MTRALYTLICYCCLPALLLRLLWRSRLDSGYRQRIPERLGFTSLRPAPGGIWIHAVSVGESLAALKIIDPLHQRFPQHALTVTTTTPTASRQIQAHRSPPLHHSYFPYDLPGAVRRFLDATQPRLLIIMETELWPNLLAGCRQRKIPVMLVNARLSERSARGYARFPRLCHEMLQGLSQVAAQYPADGSRFRRLGLAAHQLQVVGNIKFDLNLSAELHARATALRQRWQATQRPLWVAGSTHQGEEEIILEAFATVLRRRPETLLVLVPRHPERAPALLELGRRQGLRGELCSKSQPAPPAQLLIGDTLGELLLYFGTCDLAFVGGSLIPHGGHNLIEPAAWGIPVLSGPSLFNFSAVAELLREASALATVNNARQLASTVLDLIEDPSRRRSMGSAAQQVVNAHRGALGRLLTLLQKQLQGPERDPPLPPADNQHPS